MATITESQRTARLQAIDELRRELTTQLASADPLSTRATAILEALAEVERLRWATDPHGLRSPGDRVAPDLAFFRRKQVAADIEALARELAEEQGFTWNDLPAAEQARRKKSVRDRAWGAEHRRSFTVAGLYEQETLAFVKVQIDRALAEGMSWREFKRELGPAIERRGLTRNGSHTELVFRQNRRQAVAAGQWDRAQRTKRDLPNFLYNMGPSADHREHAFAWDGLIAPIDDPVWSSRMPPNGFNCRCRVTQVDRPATPGYTGEFEAVDVDQGFSYNPGDPSSVP